MKDEELKRFGENLTQMMHDRGYHPRDLLWNFPDLYSVQAIRYWMKGKNLPSMSRLRKLCEVFECSMEDFFK